MNMRAFGLIAAALIAMPSAASAQNFSDGYNFLKAVKESDGAKVMSMVDTPGTRVIDSTDPNTGEGALDIVIERGDLKYLRYLLAKGADPNTRNAKGETPAIIAVQNDFVAALDALRSAKANFNLANRSGETPLILAVQLRTLPLPDRIKMIDTLMQGGADPDKEDVIAGMSARDYAKRDSRTPALLDAIQKAGKTDDDKIQMYGPGM